MREKLKIFIWRVGRWKKANSFWRILVCAIQGKCGANVAWNCGTECPECFIDIVRIGLPSTSSIQSILQRQWSRRTGSRLASIHRTPSMREWNINTENQTAFNECYPLRFWSPTPTTPSYQRYRSSSSWQVNEDRFRLCVRTCVHHRVFIAKLSQTGKDGYGYSSDSSWSRKNS